MEDIFGFLPGGEGIPACDQADWKIRPTQLNAYSSGLIFIDGIIS
jgi:hypothetical protein